ncbi:MAG: aminoacyl-tRNA hydrolase [Campylobacterota bacterium]|nr:aminoacyl-tRNA hydrolase [Campylobacterota bacterium]
MLIVGLGNPGQTYEHNRHNIGFLVIDELICRFNATEVKKSLFQGALFKSNSHYFLKPITYMNLSGNSIAAVKQFYKIDEVIVIHDDLDLLFGALRFKKGGGHGGHNGLKSTDAMISKEYVRVRMGIGKPEHKGEVASYVLSDFSSQERPYIHEWINRAASSVEMLLKDRVENVASKYSVKKIEIE